MEYSTLSDSRQDHKRFADYKSNAHNWITLATGEYYPNVLPKNRKKNTKRKEKE